MTKHTTKKYILKTLEGKNVYTNGTGKITLDASKGWRLFTCNDISSSERCKESNASRATQQTGQKCEWVVMGWTEVISI